MAINPNKCYICQANPKGTADPDGLLCDPCYDKRQNGPKTLTPKVTLTQRSVESMHNALVEFGYPLSLAYVAEHADKMLAGEKPLGGPDMFIQGWLKDAGLIAPAK